MIGGLAASLLVVRAGKDDVLKIAAAAIAKQPSYRTVFSVSTTSGATFGIEMSGAVDQRTKVGRFSMRFSFPGARRAVTCSVLSSADTVFVPVAKQHRAQFGGKPWVESSVAGLLPIQGFSTKGFDASTFANIHGLRKDGTDTIRGVATTRYSGKLHIDKTKLTNDNPTITSAVPSDVPVDVWVSSDGLIRKFSDNFTTHVGTISVQTTTTFEYYDFGVPVNIAAPSPALVDHGDAKAAIAACLS